MLRLENISLKQKLNSKKEEIVIQDISFELPDIGLTVIKGKFNDRQPLLKVIAGFEKPHTGNLFFNNKKINSKIPLSLDKYRLHNVAVALRKNNFFDYLTIRENYQLLNEYTKVIKEEDMIRTLDYVGLDKNILDLKAAPLSDGDKQILAISKPYILGVDIIVVENPLKYLSTKEEIKKVLNLLIKISKERQVIIFTNKEDKLIEKADTVIYLDNKTVSNIETTQKDDKKIDIVKPKTVSEAKFMLKLGYNLAIGNRTRNIIIGIFLVLAIAFLLVGVSHKIYTPNLKDLKKDIENKEKYAYFTTNKNVLESNLSKPNLNDSNNNSFHSIYFLERNKSNEFEGKFLPHNIQHVVEYKDFNNSGLKLLENSNSKYPTKTYEFLVTKQTAKKMLVAYGEKDEKEENFLDHFKDITILFNGNKSSGISTYTIVGVIDDDKLPDLIYAKEGFFKSVMTEKREEISANITTEKYKFNNLNDVQNNEKISEYKKLIEKKSVLRTTKGYPENDFKKYKILTTKPYDQSKGLNSIKLEDDEIIISAELYNQIFNTIDDRLSIKIEEIKDDFTGEVISSKSEIPLEQLKTDFRLDTTIEIKPLLSSSNSIIKKLLKDLKIVGVIYGQKSISLKSNGAAIDFATQQANTNTVLISDNLMHTLTDSLNVSYEDIFDVSKISENTFNKYFSSSQDFSITSLNLQNAQNIINNIKPQNIATVFLIVGLTLLVVSLVLSYKLTNKRFSKKNNLFSMYWTGGRSQFEIQLGFFANYIMSSLVFFVLSIPFAVILLTIYKSNVLTNTLLFRDMYNFNAKAFGILVLIALITSVINAILTSLLVTRKKLLAGKKFQLKDE